MNTFNSDPGDCPFTPDELAALRLAVPLDADDLLDDATWRDQLLPGYADTLAPGTSIFGRQVLERDLRGGLDDAAVAARRARVQALLDDPAQMDALSRKLACLREADIDVATLLFADTPPPRPAWVGKLLWLPVLLAASIAAALLVSPWGWVGVGVAMYFLVMVHMRYHDRVGLWKRSVRALQMLLRACSLLDGSGLALAASFTGRGARAGRLNRSLQAATGVPGAREYANWFAAADVRYYYRTLDRVFGARDFLRECYWLCAELEADVALARHLRARPTWCWATRTDARTLAIDGDGQVLEPGVLGRTNGVGLLAEHGFDIAVQRKAEQVAEWLTQQRCTNSGSEHVF